MFQVINDLIRGIAREMLGSVRKMLRTQFQSALLIEEARHIAELRDQAEALEREGHKDLAAVIRSRADANIASLENVPTTLASDPDIDFGDDPKAKTVFAANVIASARPQLDGEVKKAPGKRGRPRKVDPLASDSGQSGKTNS